MSDSEQRQRGPADDFALDRVPPAARRPMRDILWVELGIVTGMSEFILAATLGYGMGFGKALFAILIGSTVLTVTGVVIGVAGTWEGLPSGLLARWSGFGRYGSSLISIIAVVGCIAWFGVQNSICANAIQRASHGIISFPVAATITGLVLVIIAMFGIHWVSKTASIVVPLFLVVVFYGSCRALSSSAIGPVFTEAPPGPELAVVTGASMVVGSFMVGSILAPDFTRYCRTGRDAFWVIIIAIFVGQFGLGFAGLLLAHTARTRDVISIIFGVAGWLGVTVVTLATVKLNDANLYSSSLHLANLIQVLFRCRVNRALLTAILGAVGIGFSIAGILDHVVGFLLILGIAVPPTAGVLIVDYFVLQRDREALNATRASLSLPASCEGVNPIGLLAWAAGFLAGRFIHSGVASVNSVLVSGSVYFVFMKLMAMLEHKPVKYFSAAASMPPE
jgi:cytosine permease